LSLTATDQGTWFAGLGAFAAAIVALGIALSDGWRRDRERRARARLTMASLYSPMAGVLAMIGGIEKDAIAALHAMPGNKVLLVSENVEHMQHGCDVMSPLLRTFNPSEAIYLSGDHGVALAAAIRDAELILGLVTSVTEKFLPGRDSHDYASLFKLLQSLHQVPSQARAIRKRMTPFLEACAHELGELEEGESLPDL